MNSFKTGNISESQEEKPYSFSSARIAPAVTPAELFAHFSTAMRFFQPLTFRRVETWTGPTPDLSNERILRLEGLRSFICVLRTQHRLETVLSEVGNKSGSIRSEGWLDRLVLDFGRNLAFSLFGPAPREGDAFTLRHSTPRYWPVREPEAVCRIWVGATPMEIRFWMSSQIRSN